jgi:hypothetical protein
MPEGWTSLVGVPALPPAGSPTKRILHLTDIHLDLRFEKVELSWPNARGLDITSGRASPPPAGSPPKRILQLTDIHLDLRYAKVEFCWPNVRGLETTSGDDSSPSSWFSNQEDPPAHRHPS